MGGGPKRSPTPAGVMANGQTLMENYLQQQQYPQQYPMQQVLQPNQQGMGMGYRTGPASNVHSRSKWLHPTSFSTLNGARWCRGVCGTISHDHAPTNVCSPTSSTASFTTAG